MGHLKEIGMQCLSNLSQSHGNGRDDFLMFFFVWVFLILRFVIIYWKFFRKLESCLIWIKKLNWPQKISTFEDITRNCDFVCLTDVRISDPCYAHCLFKISFLSQTKHFGLPVVKYINQKSVLRINIQNPQNTIPHETIHHT